MEIYIEKCGGGGYNCAMDLGMAVGGGMKHLLFKLGAVVIVVVGEEGL